MSGAFQTPEGLKHWKPEYNAEVCPFCNQAGNSKKHLFFDCPKTAEARQKYKKFIEESLEWIETIFSLPVCTISAEENILNRIRFDRPLPKAVFNYADQTNRTFYTDGSATISDFETDREASWAIVEDICQ